MNDVQWALFEIKDYFTVSSGKDIDLFMNHGDLPYINSSRMNNGVTNYVEEAIKVDKNILTVARTGSVGYTFYHQNEVGLSGNIRILKPKELNLNPYIGLFLSSVLTKQFIKQFSYGNILGTERLKRAKVLLPAKSNNTPDWTYMEEYIKTQKFKSIDKTLIFLKKELKKVGDFKKLSLADANWKQFTLADLFVFQTGKSKGLNHLKQGDIQYLGATNRNNGVLQKNNKLIFVEDSGDLVQKGNGIAFIRNGEGSMGYSVYKSSEFIATSDITVGYNKYLNEYIGLFISRVTDQTRGKYSFNYKRSDTRLKKEKIMLPTTDEGKPDYAFMENYIKRLKYERIQKLLKFLSEGRNI